MANEIPKEVFEQLAQQTQPAKEMKFPHPGRYKLPLAETCQGATFEKEAMCLELQAANGVRLVAPLSQEAMKSIYQMLSALRARNQLLKPSNDTSRH